MKWFKHMSNMRHDTRIRRLISKFGLKGYGLYCFILESVTEGLETDSPLPELEEMSIDIAELFHDDTVKIEEMILFCMNQGLFEQSELTGKIMCQKIYKFIDQSSTRSKEIRGMIAKYKNHPNIPRLSETVSDYPDRSEEKKRTEKNIKEDNISPEEKQDTPPYSKILEFFNNTTGTQYKTSTKATQSLIRARFKEGFSLDDFKTVIERMFKKWSKDEKMKDYLRPSTLFGTKFESYLNLKDNNKDPEKLDYAEGFPE